MKKLYSMLLTLFTMILTALPAFAALDTEVDGMFDAVDMSGLKTKVIALVSSVLLIPLVFATAALIKRTINSARS